MTAQDPHPAPAPGFHIDPLTDFSKEPARQAMVHV